MKEFRRRRAALSLGGTLEEGQCRDEEPLVWTTAGCRGACFMCSDEIASSPSISPWPTLWPHSFPFQAAANISHADSLRLSQTAGVHLVWSYLRQAVPSCRTAPSMAHPWRCCWSDCQRRPRTLRAGGNLRGGGYARWDFSHKQAMGCVCQLSEWMTTCLKGWQGSGCNWASRVSCWPAAPRRTSGWCWGSSGRRPPPPSWWAGFVRCSCSWRARGQRRDGKKIDSQVIHIYNSNLVHKCKKNIFVFLIKLQNICNCAAVFHWAVKSNAHK